MHLEYPECIFEIDEMNAIFDAEEILRDHQRQG